MEKNIEITASNNTTAVFENVMNAIKAPFNFMRNYYSGIIGREISAKQTWLITEVQIAFVFAVFPVEAPFVLRILSVLWLISSLLRTKSSFE